MNILITGSPASGKTTVTNYIESKFKQATILRFGQLLFEFKKREIPNMSYSDFKKEATNIIKTSDVKSIDDFIIKQASKCTNDVFIETHGVTVESYGLKITPYENPFQIKQLKLKAIICINSEPSKIVERVKLQFNEGRLVISIYIAQLNNQLQDNLAINYSIISGCPLYVIENNTSISELYCNTDLVLKNIGLIK